VWLILYFAWLARRALADKIQALAFVAPKEAMSGTHKKDRLGKKLKLLIY